LNPKRDADETGSAPAKLHATAYLCSLVHRC
jgi:hypothetical protein